MSSDSVFDSCYMSLLKQFRIDVACSTRIFKMGLLVKKHLLTLKVAVYLLAITPPPHVKQTLAIATIT